MADLGDFLRHVLDRVGAPGEAHRQEFLDAINAEFPPPASPEPEPGTDAAAQARIAELEADLAAARAQAPGSG